MRLTWMLAAAFCLIAAAEEPAPKPRAGKVASLTGCVDQKGEQYVLTSVDSMQVMAVLRGRAFTDDNFARYVGQKAEVQGELREEKDERVLHVTRIDKISETCR